MSDKLHALKWNKPATSSWCFNSIIPFSLLQGFHHHCEKIDGDCAEETEVLGVNSARQLFPLVIASRRRNNLTPRHPEGAKRLKDLLIDHGILRLLRTTLSVGLLRHCLLFPFLAHCARNNYPRNDIPCYHCFALGFGSLASRRQNGLSLPCRYHAACCRFFIVKWSLDGNKDFLRDLYKKGEN